MHRTAHDRLYARRRNRPDLFEGRSSRVYDFAARRLLRRLYRRLAADIAATAPPDSKILDVGTGPGVLLVELAKRRTDLHLTGIDLSADMIVAATRNLDRFGFRTTAQVGDVTNLPFPDGSFDLVVSSLSLHHWDEPEAAVPELARVLRPGGRLVAITNSRTQLAELWKAVEYEPTESGFSSENGRAQLEAHFSHVERHDIVPMAVFEDRATAAAYIESLGSERAALVSRLPDDGWPLVAHGATSVFVADK